MITAPMLQLMWAAGEVVLTPTEDLAQDD